MRDYRLSIQAEQRLEEIFGWAIDNFGIEQAIRYKDQLILRLSSMAAGELPQGKPCNNLLEGKREASDLEYYREGRHFIIYRNTPDGILVLDFVHGSRDLEAIVKEINTKLW
jgi:toxin ParE1/3/4